MNQIILNPVVEATDITPLVRRLQKALLDGHTISLNGALHTWAPRNALLPELDPKDTHEYAAREAGIFRVMEIQRDGEKHQKWVRQCALDAMDDLIGPHLLQLSKPERDAISIGLTFQLGMAKEQASSMARRHRFPR